MTIEEFGRKLRAREISAREMTDECLHRIAAGNERLNSFIHVMTDEARRSGGRGRPRAGGRARPGLAPWRADLHQGHLRHSRDGDDGRLTRAGGSRCAARRAGDRTPASRGRGSHRQNESSRVRVRHDQRRFGIRAGAQSPRSDPLAWWIEWRLRGQRCRRYGTRVSRLGYRRIHSNSRRGMRNRRVEAHATGSSRPRASCRCRERWTTSAHSHEPFQTRGTCFTRSSGVMLAARWSRRR